MNAITLLAVIINNLPLSIIVTIIIIFNMILLPTHLVPVTERLHCTVLYTAICSEVAEADVVTMH